MDSDSPNVLLTPKKAFRAKTQILMEEFGTVDLFKIWEMERDRRDIDPSEAPPPETWTTLKLPYQAPSCPPLPSWDQVRIASRDARLSHGIELHDVCRIGDNVIKYAGGLGEDIVEEAENLLFLAEKLPQLKIPTVLAVWKMHVKDETQEGFIHCLMTNFIDGIVCTAENLIKLPLQAQDNIASKITAQIQCLRSLPSEGYYGRVHRQGSIDPPPGIRTNTSDKPIVTGPYHTYEEFTIAIHQAEEIAAAARIRGRTPEFHEITRRDLIRILTAFPDWHPQEPKFTWLDPKAANILARSVKDDTGNEDWEVFLIDWEAAGWYPAWLQSFQFADRFNLGIRDPSLKGPPRMTDKQIYYRDDEIRMQVLDGFDPDRDKERIDRLMKGSFPWTFY